MLLLISGFAVALITAYIIAKILASKGVKRDYTCMVKGEG
jgi:hypothetical protein